jgi:ribonuclease P protein component
MLPKINRIKKKKDFEIIFKNSKIFKTNLFIFRIAKNNLKLNRFGFVVSLKVSKKATVRNKIRRRLTEAIKIEIKNMPLEAQVKIGTDLVIIALPGIEKREFSEIKETINNALIKTGLISK